VAAGFGGGDFDVEEPLEERGVAEVLLGGVVEFGRQRFGRCGETEVGEMATQLLIGRVLRHHLVPSTSSA
jgi:hypothetical protein